MAGRAERLRGRLDAPAVALVAVLALGTLERLALMAGDRPGFLGYPDSAAYVLAAFSPGHPFLDPLRVAGYPVFLHALRDLRADPSLVTLVQHALGVATALGLYVVVRALGVRSRWVAVAPAAVVALGPWQVQFEHAFLSEALWEALIVAAVLLVVLAARTRARPALALGAIVLAGLVLGVATTVRLPSLFAAPVLLAWAVLAAPRPWWRRIAVGVALVLAAVAPVLAFSEWHEDRTGRGGLTINGVVNVYGRVAPWADCTKFTPPAGTRFLCERTPVRDRGGPEAYVFGPSPFNKRFGTGGLTVPMPPGGAERVSAWARAAILGQPSTYLLAVARESRRLIDPDARVGLPGQRHDGYGPPPDAYPVLLRSTSRDTVVFPVIRANYPGWAVPRHGDSGWFEALERRLRVPPPIMAAVLALALLAPFATRGPERRAALLLTPLSLALLELPIATSLYNYRYVTPVYGLLSAAAAIGLWGVAVSAAGRARRGPLRRGAPGGPR